MSNIELKKANQMAAIDILIHNPEITKTELAQELKVTPQTIHGWFADDRFVDMYYKQYMVSFKVHAGKPQFKALLNHIVFTFREMKPKHQRNTAKFIRNLRSLLMA